MDKCLKKLGIGLGAWHQKTGWPGFAFTDGHTKKGLGSDYLRFFSVNEPRTAFEQAVDDYLQTCKALAREPNRPYSGQFRLRIPATLHAQAVVCAKSQDKSLNAWITDAIKQQVQQNV